MVSAILRCKNSGLSNEDTIKLLAGYFEYEDIEECLRDIEPNQVFAGLPQCVCPNCAECEYSNGCYFQKDSIFIEKLLKAKSEYFTIKTLLELLDE